MWKNPSSRCSWLSSSVFIWLSFLDEQDVEVGTEGLPGLVPYLPQAEAGEFLSFPVEDESKWRSLPVRTARDSRWPLRKESLWFLGHRNVWVSSRWRSMSYFTRSHKLEILKYIFLMRAKYTLQQLIAFSRKIWILVSIFICLNLVRLKVFFFFLPHLRISWKLHIYHIGIVFRFYNEILYSIEF